MFSISGSNTSEFKQEISRVLKEINHPMAATLQALRELILASDSTIAEGIKWNSLSFRTTEWFATLNKRALDRIEFVFHLGAKPREAEIKAQIPEFPGHILWKSHDRCIVSFADNADFEIHREEFQDFVKAWIQQVSDDQKR